MRSMGVQLHPLLGGGVGVQLHVLQFGIDLRGAMRVTTDDAAELERVLRDVEEQQKTPKSKHEGYGRELVPFFHPGLDTINSKLVTFPKKGQVEGKETESKSNKGKGKGKKEEAGHETNRDGGDAARKKKGGNAGTGGNGTKTNNPAGANGTPTSGKTSTNAKRGPAFAGPAFSQSPEPEELPMPTQTLLLRSPLEAKETSSTNSAQTEKSNGQADGNEQNLPGPHMDLSMELKNMLQVGLSHPQGPPKN